LAKARRELNDIEAKISDFEMQYSMKSEDFAQKFHAGLVDDSADFMEWISFLDIRCANVYRIQSLANIGE
jgi:hypothetical protein